MADDNNPGMIMEVTSHADELNGGNHVSEMTETIENEDEIGITDEDILNEALVSAPASFSETVQLQYTMPDNSETLHETGLLDQGTEQVCFIKSEDSTGQLTHTFTPEHFIENGNDVFIQHTNSGSIEEGTLMESSIVQENSEQSPSTSQSLNSVISQPLILTRQLPQTSNAPLGSSQNPIRIIQQGNQYTPVQQLSKEQLQQIMHVVQQQQSVKNPSSSVLFNSQTNTKIVYRVIYPSQLHKDGDIPPQQEDDQALQTPKRPHKKKMKEEEQEKIDTPDLSREEKESRKKICPNTRSGRVSKPPKHMVKDFKHIHVLDYDEECDDSDGGYSDFKYSDGEEGESISRKDNDENFVAYGMFR